MSQQLSSSCIKVLQLSLNFSRYHFWKKTTKNEKANDLIKKKEKSFWEGHVDIFKDNIHVEINDLVENTENIEEILWEQAECAAQRLYSNLRLYRCASGNSFTVIQQFQNTRTIYGLLLCSCLHEDATWRKRCDGRSCCCAGQHLQRVRERLW